MICPFFGFRSFYRVVKKIPSGKVATYGQIAKLVQNSKFKVQSCKSKSRVTPNMVGWALHANRDKDVPCHRVVNKDGRLAPNFAFDGDREQRRRLEAEGVKFEDQKHVDLKVCLWQLG